MENNRIRPQQEVVICPNAECKYLKCILENNKVCIYLKRNGSYTYCCGKYKVRRYKCSLLQETFSDKTFDNNTRCFHSLKPSLEEVYGDYLRGCTLLDISKKYGISISKVRTRIKRGRQMDVDKGNHN